MKIIFVLLLLSGCALKSDLVHEKNEKEFWKDNARYWQEKAEGRRVQIKLLEKENDELEDKLEASIPLEQLAIGDIQIESVQAVNRNYKEPTPRIQKIEGKCYIGTGIMLASNPLQEQLTEVPCGPNRR